MRVEFEIPGKPITKDELEEILSSYGVAFTSSLADRLLEVIKEEVEKAKHEQ